MKRAVIKYPSQVRFFRVLFICMYVVCICSGFLTGIDLLKVWNWHMEIKPKISKKLFLEINIFLVWFLYIFGLIFWVYVYIMLVVFKHQVYMYACLGLIWLLLFVWYIYRLTKKLIWGGGLGLKIKNKLTLI